MHCGVLNFLVVPSYLSLNRQNKMPIIVCPPAPTGSKVSRGPLLEIIHLGLLTKGGGRDRKGANGVWSPQCGSGFGLRM